MARKVVNRKELRAEAEAAEAAGIKAAPKKKKKAPAKRKKKAEPVEVRMKLFWGVFNQSLKRVAMFEFDQKAAADQKALSLNKTGKTPHFVQRVKEIIKE